MSATLRYDVGTNIFWAIQHRFRAVADSLVAKQAMRWAGVNKPRWVCYTFAIKLPKDIAKACHLMAAVHKLQDEDCVPSFRKGLDGLARKLRLSVGMPEGKPPEDEDGFLFTIADNPGDLATWHVYSDFLQDAREPERQRRGLVIAGWLSDKPMKVKYGVPLLALGKEEA